MPELIELARETLSLPVQIGFPAEVDGVVDKIDDPSYATAIGLVLFAAKGGSQRSYSVANVDFGKILDGVKSFFKKLLP